MDVERKEKDFQRYWRRLQQIGLNAYEARSYLVLVGHPRFKALELAARAHVPRQKIYEVLDSLVEKGFAEVIQDKTKLFSAVEPALAVPTYIARRREELAREAAEQAKLAESLVTDLASAYSEGQDGRGTLDFLRIVSDPGQIATQYRRMLGEVQREYVEFSRPPYAVDPLEEQLVRDAIARGVSCRLLIESRSIDARHRALFDAYNAAGVLVKEGPPLPMKLALFDGTRGLVALLDPVITKPTWTAVVFEHPGMGEAMKGLFEEYWRRSLD
jgi:sugar-specific transcriptional regulator TrmB